MAPTTDQIETYIENKREDLGSNLQELETKFSSMTDWKQQFEKHPMMMIGAAVGGGLLLATMMRGRRRRDRVFSSPGQGAASSSAPSTGHLKNAALETWGLIKSAFAGVAAARVKDYVEEIVPGFREQFERAKR